MPVIDFAGRSITIDAAYSYARVSTTRQADEQEGIGRQIGLSQAWAARHGITLDQELSDLGKSGSKGTNLKDGAALAVFMDLSIKKRLKPNAALIVESFSRLGRLPIDEALDLFLTIVAKGRCTLITLIDGHCYTRESLRGNPGEIHLISAHMSAARAEAESKAHYATQGWQRRRGTAKSVYPAWIIDVDGVLEVDEPKAAIIRRICDLALRMGTDKIAKLLNDEGAPLLSTRKRQRDTHLWDRAVLVALLRSRKLLGEQAVGHYIEGKRQVTGEFIQAYPAVVSEEQWHAIQGRIDARKMGGVTAGRNVNAGYTNLFGDLAQCGACQSRMKIVGKQKQTGIRYLGCSAATLGGCANTRFYRIDRVEAAVLPKLCNVAIDLATTDDPVESLSKQITVAKSDLARIAAAYMQSMTRTGDLAAMTQAALERDHAAKVAELAKLERDRGAAAMATPLAELQATVRGLEAAVLAGNAVARAELAAVLPSLLRSVVCHPDGTLTVNVRGTGVNAGYSKPIAA